MNVIRFLLFSSVLLTLLTGCSLSPRQVQYPTLGPQNQLAAKKAAQVQDPFPDASIGPSTGFRPLGYQTQRSQPQQVRDRYYTGFLKTNFGAPSPAQPGLMPQGGASSYNPALSQQQAVAPVVGRPLPNQAFAIAPQPVMAGPAMGQQMVVQPPVTMQAGASPQYSPGYSHGSYYPQPGVIR